jgi:pimeloyl-ACP methyl ester carboxylesterase
MADDVAALIGHLGLGNVDLMGYSLGGGVALRAAIQHPDLVDKLVLVSTPCKRNGWYPEVLQGMQQGADPKAAKMMKQTPMYQAYSRVAPRIQDWPVLMTKLAELLRRDYDWSAEVMEMKPPTMLVIGDADSVRTAHAIEFFELLGGGKRDGEWDGSGMPKSRLAILPGTTHYAIFSSPALASSVVQFLGSGSR